LGNVSYDRDRTPFLQPDMKMPQERSYGDRTADAVDSAVRGLVDAALARAVAILRANRALLDRAATALLASETLNRDEIDMLRKEIVAVP